MEEIKTIEELDEWFNQFSLTTKFKIVCHYFITDDEYKDATLEEMSYEAFGAYKESEEFINEKWKSLSDFDKIECFNIYYS